MKTDRFGLTKRDALSLDAAKLYYAGLSQQAIAERLFVTRPTVSKLITHAKQRGFVRTVVDDPRENDQRVIGQLQQRYGLTSVHLVSPLGSGPIDIRRALGRAGAQVLAEILLPQDSLAVCWSETVSEIVAQFSARNATGITVLQGRGFVGDERSSLRTVADIERLATTLLGTAEFLESPAIQSSLSTKNETCADSAIKNHLVHLTQSRVLLYSVGSLERTSTLFRSELLTEAEKEKLKTESVGDTCSHYVDEAGRVCLPDMNARTVGISLPQIRKVEQKILVSGGADKIRAIHAALQWGYVNHLVTDTASAHELLSLHH